MTVVLNRKKTGKKLPLKKIKYGLNKSTVFIWTCLRAHYILVLRFSKNSQYIFSDRSKERLVLH